MSGVNNIRNEFEHFFNRMMDVGKYTKQTCQTVKDMLINAFKTNYREISSCNGIEVNDEDFDQLGDCWAQLVAKYF